MRNYEGIIENLDYNLLMSLALGYVCIVYDYGSRGNAMSDEREGIPRAFWYLLIWLMQHPLLLCFNLSRILRIIYDLPFIFVIWVFTTFHIRNITFLQVGHGVDSIRVRSLLALRRWRSRGTHTIISKNCFCHRVKILIHVSLLRSVEGANGARLQFSKSFWGSSETPSEGFEAEIEVFPCILANKQNTFISPLF